MNIRNTKPPTEQTQYLKNITLPDNQGYNNRMQFVQDITGISEMFFSVLSMVRPTPMDKHGKTIYYPKPEIPDRPKEATRVNDNMDFNQAFVTARQQVSATGYFKWKGYLFNTLYADERDKLTKDELDKLYERILLEYTAHIAYSHEDIAIVIHEAAPIAKFHDDTITFREAYLSSRKDVGPGGIFQYKGEFYSTYTNEEFERLNNKEKQIYSNSLNGKNVKPSLLSCKDINITDIDLNDKKAEDEGHFSNVFLCDGILGYMGKDIYVSYFLKEGNTMLKYKTNRNSKADAVIFQNEDGSYTHIGDDETIISESLIFHHAIHSESLENDIDETEEYLFPDIYNTDEDIITGDDYSNDADTRVF